MRRGGEVARERKSLEEKSAGICGAGTVAGPTPSPGAAGGIACAGEGAVVIVMAAVAAASASAPVAVSLRAVVSTLEPRPMP